MFKKWRSEDISAPEDTGIMSTNPSKEISKAEKPASNNTILRGSRLTGDISVSCDLELSGEIEGNITSEKDSNIVIKGTCHGDITTREGSVRIDGQMTGGNITAGKNITISGKFEGGALKAKGRITINGEFNGKLEADEIEIGQDASGTGELFYKKHIEIEKGATIEGQITKLPAQLQLIKNEPEPVKSAADEPAKKTGGA